MNGKQLVDRLLSSGLASADTIIPCENRDIVELENTVKMHLPAAYKEWLTTAGKMAGMLFADVNMFYPAILTNNEWALEKLSAQDGPTPSLPENALVFGSRSGERFMFFVVDNKTDDPEVFHYYQGRPEFRRIASSVWRIIETELVELETMKRNDPTSPWWLYAERNAQSKARKLRNS